VVNETGLPLRSEPLGRHHNRLSFTCGVEILDRYLRQQASQDVRSGVAAVFVFSSDDGAVVGFYSLSACTLNLSDIAPDLAKKLPRYPVVPATLLGRLAVDQNMRGRGVCQALLMDSFKRAYSTVASVASWAMIVDAKDDEARRFYEHFDFLRLLNQSSRLYLPMSEIKKLVEIIST